MQYFSRRDFLQDSTLFGAALSVLGAAGTSSAQPEEKAARKGPANDQIRVAVIGVNGRGMDHVGGFTNKKHNCFVAAICDPDEAVIGNAMKAIEKAQGKQPRYEPDIRKLL